MATQPVKRNVVRIEKHETGMRHVYFIDWADTGILREMAVLKEFDDGTIHAVDVALLHPIDKARLKKIITSVHADKYELWELMSQSRLPNGLNALDYFVKNFLKVKQPKGAFAGSGLAYAGTERLTELEGTQAQVAQLDRA